MKRFQKIILVLIINILMAPVAYSQTPIKIAALFGMTGKEASGFHIDTIIGLRLAVEEWNRNHQNLLGREIQLIIYDHQSEKIKAAEMVKKAKNDGAVAIIGSRWSSLTTPAAIVAQQLGIPLITPSATSKEITEIGDHIFRIAWMGLYPAKVLARFANHKFKEKAASLEDITTLVYKNTCTEPFVQEYQQLRPETTVNRLTFADSDLDFSKQLNQIKNLKPGAVSLASSSRNAQMIFQQAEKLKLKINWLAYDSIGPTSIPPGGFKYGRVYALAQYYPDQNNAVLQGMIKKAEAMALQLQLEPKNLKTSDPFPLAFDAASILFTAIQKANSTDHQAIIRTLSNIDYQGLTGRIKFDQNRNPVRDVFIMLAESGQTNFQYIEKFEAK